MSTPPSASAPRTLQALGARRAAPGSPTSTEVVRQLRELNAENPAAFVALFDARGIAGERHLLSAWAHLGRSRAHGEPRLRDRSAEFALYVAGDDQLPRALAKVGVATDTEEFVLVCERPRAPEELLRAFGLLPDPSVYPRYPTAPVLTRLGVEPSEREAVPQAAWEGLVLERVALVDLSPARSEGGGSTKKA